MPEVGISTRRAGGTPAASASGRRRCPASFIGRFTIADVQAIAATPVSAARRPRRPPKANNTVAAPIHSLEWSAALVNVRSGPSIVGVDVAATAR
jgi:hypothetical protein